MHIVHALIDYDNIVAGRIPEQSRIDVRSNLTGLANTLTIICNGLGYAVEQVSVRLYGGWIDLMERETPRAAWIRSELPRFRTRVNGLRVRMSLATSLIAFPEFHFVGTYRPQSSPGQKMVDTMLAINAIELSSGASGFGVGERAGLSATC
jgi:hypothetical protein